MGSYEQQPSAVSSNGSSSSSSGTKPAPEMIMDGLLAGAGYKVKSAELHQVARRIERLENVIMVNSAANISHLAHETVHYDPSDIGSWVDTLLTELNQTISLPCDLLELPDLPSSCPFIQETTSTPSPPTIIENNIHNTHFFFNSNNNNNNNDNNNNPMSMQQQQLTVVTSMEENSGIRLVHMLMTCADSLQRGEFPLASSLIEDMQNLLVHVNTSCGIGKVAGYFIDALSRRIFSPRATSAAVSSPYEDEVLYHHYYEACPYLKFAHFTANQAILEAFNGHDCVHVIDFNLMHGLQWPALIQALALRPGGPPLLRLTGIGPPSPDGRDTLREIGLRLAELARSVNVRFAFRGVAATRLEDVKPWMLQVGPKEAVAVNSIMQLHRLLGSDSIVIESVLSWIRSLNPKIMTVVEQDSNHNQAGFLDRFTEALYYYSTMFDSLEACSLQQPDKALAEMYIQKEICNVVCCEGSARVERHEPLGKWRDRLSKAGFRALHLGSNAFKQASMLLTLFSAEGYCVEENEGCLTLGWHSRPLIAASAWQAAPEYEVA